MLKSRWFQLVTMLIVGLIAGWFAHSKIESIERSSARSNVYDLLLEQERAWNEGNLAGFLSHYAMNADITFFSDDRVSKGWVSLSDRYTKKYGGGKAAMGKLAFDDLDFNVLAPNAVQVRGRWTTSDTPNAGTGLFTILVCNTENGWKVVHDHTSAKPKPCEKCGYLKNN